MQRENVLKTFELRQGPSSKCIIFPFEIDSIHYIHSSKTSFRPQFIIVCSIPINILYREIYRKISTYKYLFYYHCVSVFFFFFLFNCQTSMRGEYYFFFFSVVLAYKAFLCTCKCGRDLFKVCLYENQRRIKKILYSYASLLLLQTTLNIPSILL